MSCQVLWSVKETIGNLELHMPRSHTAEKVGSCLPKCCPFSEDALSECCNGWQRGKNKALKQKRTLWNSLWEQLEFVSFTSSSGAGRLITKLHLVPLTPDVSVSVYQALISQLLYWYLLPKASTTGQENSQKIQFSFLFKVAMQLL